MGNEEGNAKDSQNSLQNDPAAAGGVNDQQQKMLKKQEQMQLQQQKQKEEQERQREAALQKKQEKERKEREKEKEKEKSKGNKGNKGEEDIIPPEARAVNPIPPELQIMIVGLDNAGKTSILSRIMSEKTPKGITPTAGFQVEKFLKGKTNFTVYDMAGATSFRNLWDENLKGCQVLVFVVDSADKFRIVVAREELETLMGQPDMEGVPVLIFANKNDLPQALNYSKVSEQMGLEEISDRSWNIISSSAVTGAGIADGIDWVLKNYKKK